MTADLARLAAALTAEAAACRAEAARFTDRNPRRPIRVDPSKGQANPDVYAQVQLAHAGLCESLAARLTDPAGDSAAEAKLAALRSVLLEGGQDASTVRRRALAIISTEEGESRG